MNAVRSSRRRRAASRDGYALLAVLWICVGVGGVGMLVTTTARESSAASLNRVALMRAEWIADGCIARVRSVLAEALREEAAARRPPRSPAWIRADRVLAASPMLSSTNCEVTAVPVGSRLDVNGADERILSRLFQRLEMSAERADSLAAAIADWRDRDDTPRPLGAERDWYRAEGRPGPANRPFRSVRELRLVRGAADSLRLGTVLDVEPGGLSINHAPPPLLSILPGFGPELTGRVQLLRTDAPFRAWSDLSEGVSPSARAAIDDALPRLAGLVTFEPRGWIVTAVARVGAPEVTLAVEVRLERAGADVGVVRRKSWIP